MVGLTSTTAVGSTTEESPNDKHQDHRSRGTVAGHDSSGLILTCHLEFQQIWPLTRQICILIPVLIGDVDMEKEESIETQSSMKKLIFYATVIAGFVAAYMMYRRGESLGTIAKQTITNPVGSLVSEVKNTVYVQADP